MFSGCCSCFCKLSRYLHFFVNLHLLLRHSLFRVHHFFLAFFGLQYPFAEQNPFGLQSLSPPQQSLLPPHVGGGVGEGSGVGGGGGFGEDSHSSSGMLRCLATSERTSRANEPGHIVRLLQALSGSNISSKVFISRIISSSSRFGFSFEILSSIPSQSKSMM